MKQILIALLALTSATFLDAQTGTLPGPAGPHPEPRSGFYGQLLFYHSAGPGSDLQPPAEGIPYKTFISVYDSNGILLKRVISNPVGQFYSYVKPGNYTLL